MCSMTGVALDEVIRAPTTVPVSARATNARGLRPGEANDCYSRRTGLCLSSYSAIRCRKQGLSAFGIRRCGGLSSGLVRSFARAGRRQQRRSNASPFDTVFARLVLRRRAS